MSGMRESGLALSKFHRVSTYKHCNICIAIRTRTYIHTNVRRNGVSLAILNIAMTTLKFIIDTIVIDITTIKIMLIKITVSISKGAAKICVHGDSVIIIQQT